MTVFLVVFFFKVHQKHRTFSWPYVEIPSTSATASNDLSSDDIMMMLLRLKLLKLFQKIDNRTKVSKAEQLVIFQPQYRWLNLYDINLSYTHQ